MRDGFFLTGPLTYRKFIRQVNYGQGHDRGICWTFSGTKLIAIRFRRNYGEIT